MKRPFRYLSWIITLPLGILVISFAVSNRDAVALMLWPLPSGLEMPIFLPVLGALVAGFVAGGAIAWWTGGRYRRLARRQSGQLKRQKAELETLRAREAESADARDRRLEAERLEAAARASETSALREGPAPRRLTSLNAR
jgi:uncharacterized integral membrane protein